MSLASYTLLMMIIAVSNAILGFGGAMLLGLGPRMPKLKLQFAWRPWLAALTQFFSSLWRRLRRQNSTPPAPPPCVADETIPCLTLTPIQFGDHAAPRVEAVRNAHAPPPAVEEEAVSLDDALAQLALDITQMHDELGQLDQRVRTCTTAPTIDSVEECVADLKQTGHRLYEQQTQAIAAAQENRADGYSAGVASNETHKFIEQHAEQLRQSLEEFDGWQVDPDNLAGDCRRLLAATEQLMQSCDEVEQVIEEAATANEPFDPARPTATATEPHAIPHESIHSVARVGRA